MGLFDSIPTKIEKASPPQFKGTLDYAIDLMLMKDQAIMQNPVQREAYCGVVLGMLAIVSNEIMYAWSAADVREITRLVQTANARLSPEVSQRAQVRLKDVTSYWNLKWDE